jgi:hypothetical protein
MPRHITKNEAKRIRDYITKFPKEIGKKEAKRLERRYGPGWQRSIEAKIMRRRMIREMEAKRLEKAYGKKWRESEEARVQWERAGNRLMKKAARAKDDYAKTTFVRELVRLKYTPAEYMIRTYAESAENFALKLECIRALGELGSKSSLDTLLSFIDSNSPTMRKALIRVERWGTFRGDIELAERIFKDIRAVGGEEVIKEAIEEWRAGRRRRYVARRSKNGKRLREMLVHSYMLTAAEAAWRLVKREKKLLTKQDVMAIKRVLEQEHVRNAKHPRVRAAVQKLMEEIRHIS